MILVFLYISDPDIPEARGYGYQTIQTGQRAHFEFFTGLDEMDFP